MNHDEKVQIIRSLIDEGKVKTKGAYEVLHFEKLGFHKNHSAMIIPMAVLAHVLGLESYTEFVKNHKDPFDFFLRTKVPRSSRLVLVDDEGNDIPQQNICRYYPSIGGGSLVKIMPPLENGGEDRRMAVDKEWKVKTCNNMDNFEHDIDMRYYIQEVEKLLAPLKEDVTNSVIF